MKTLEIIFCVLVGLAGLCHIIAAVGQTLMAIEKFRESNDENKK